MPLDFIN